MPLTVPSSRSIKANLLISSVQLSTGRNFRILLTIFTCVCTRCLTEGVTHPEGRFLLLKRASVLMISFTFTGSLHPGSFLSIRFFIVVPSLLARRFLAMRSPLRDACLCARRSDIRRAISLFLVVTWSLYTTVPSAVITALPIFVLPGSVPPKRGCVIQGELYRS